MDKVEKYRIGGADVPAIFGISKWQTPLELYSVKKGIIPKPLFAQELRQQVGLALEELILRKYKAWVIENLDGVNLNKDKIVQYPYPDNLRTHPQYEWMLGSLDAEAHLGGKDVVVELKTGNSFGDWGDGEDEVPKDYLLQVHHYFNCTGYEVAHVPVLFTDKMTFRVYVVKKNPELCDLVMEACLGFYDRLVNDNPPEVSSSDDVLLKYKEVVGESEAEATGDVEAAVLKLKELKGQSKELDLLIEEQELIVKDAIGNCEKLVKGGAVLATFKESETSRLDTTLLKKECPEVYEQYVKKSKYRRLLLK